MYCSCDTFGHNSCLPVGGQPEWWADADDVRIPPESVQSTGRLVYWSTSSTRHNCRLCSHNTRADDSTVVTFHQCECNVPLKQTNKRGGSRPLQASSVRETDAAPLRGLFANDQHLFSLRVRRRLQLQYTHSLPFLCTTVTGSAHCLAHTKETELDHFLDVSALFLCKRETLKSILVVTPPTPRTPPPPPPPTAPPPSQLVAETRVHFFFFLPPPDHHC